ncbi:MAG: DUF362 domain-containing protein, partial [bacterium]|nr:DUF362 domain-containing protein [bacterium]
GFTEAAAKAKATLNFDTEICSVAVTNGLRLATVDLLRPAMLADVIINMPKLKTHGLTTLTCAVKNMFGLIPGLTKIEYHMRSPKVDDFCAMLVDIANAAAPELTVVDAIEAMEGEGPSGGSPKAVGLIMVGTNMHAIDWVAADLMGLDPMSVPTIAMPEKHGLGIGGLANITIIGSREPSPAFLLPKARSNLRMVEKYLPPKVVTYLANKLRPIPLFLPNKCIKCGICVNSCPPKALKITKDLVPQLNHRLCISCLCCQELCPEHAIDIKRSWLGWLLFK